MTSLICLNRIYSDWRGDVGNRIFICLCGATLTLNLAPITLTIITKDTRGRNSAKLFLVAFFGNSCTVLSLIITTALRFDNRLSCTSLKVIYVMFQYGMTLSSYSLLSLVYLNFRLTKSRALLSQRQKVRMSIQITIIFITISCITLFLSCITIIFNTIPSFIPILIVQFVADFISVVYCVKLHRVFSRIVSLSVRPVSQQFVKQAKDSKKLILPAVATTSFIKIIFYIVNIFLGKTNQSVFTYLAWVHTIYFLNFILLPCLYVYRQKNIRLPIKRILSRKKIVPDVGRNSTE